MIKMKRKLKPKPNKFEEVLEKPIVTKKLILYKKKKCTYVSPTTGVQCRNNCDGKDNMCYAHGAERAKEAMIRHNMSLQLTPSKYSPATHPLQYIMLSRQGLSDVEIAAEFEISLTTLRNWTEKHTEFAEAYDVGQSMHEAWWLQEGKGNLHNRFYQTGLYKFLTGNKLGYSDKIETKNLNHNSYGVLLVPGAMSIDEWEQANIKEDQEIIDAEINTENNID